MEQGALAVTRFAKCIYHAPEPAGRWPHRARNRRYQRPAAATHAFQRGERHEQRVRSGKSDDLARNGLAGSLDDHRAPTDMACSGPATSTIKPRTPTTRP